MRITKTIYSNNKVHITAEVPVDNDDHDTKINCNGENLIWISKVELEDFKKDITELLDRYRI